MYMTIMFKFKIFVFLFISAFFVGILNPTPNYASAYYHEESSIQKTQQKKAHLLILLNDLREGDENQNVKALQDRLKLLGFFPKNVKSTGFFGPITKKAVMDFQKSRKIKQTGFVEILTRANLALTGFK